MITLKRLLAIRYIVKHQAFRNSNLKTFFITPNNKQNFTSRLPQNATPHPMIDVAQLKRFINSRTFHDSKKCADEIITRRALNFKRFINLLRNYYAHQSVVFVVILMRLYCFSTKINALRSCLIMTNGIVKISCDEMIYLETFFVDHFRLHVVTTQNSEHTLDIGLARHH